MTRLWTQFTRGRTRARRRSGNRREGYSRSDSRNMASRKAMRTAFAILAYQSSWLKHYYPAEFVCALLNNQPMGFYPPHVLTNDDRPGGVKVVASCAHSQFTRAE